MPTRLGSKNKDHPIIAGRYYRTGQRFGEVGDENFGRWLAVTPSFTYSRYANWRGDPDLITCRREKRREKFVWYGYKTSDKKTYKVYIGTDDAINSENLKSAADKMRRKIGI